MPWPQPCRTRTGVRGEQADRSAVPATDVTLDRLRSATQQAQAVRVGYVTADGRAVERELAPLDLAAGSVRAVDRASAQVVTIPLARISAVSPVPHSDPSVTS